MSLQRWQPHIPNESTSSQTNGLSTHHQKSPEHNRTPNPQTRSTKQIQPIDAAALKLTQDPDDTHMYVNELMKSIENEQNDERLCFPTPENLGNEEEHTPIQRRIRKEFRELFKKEQLDPTKDEESRKEFLDMVQWE